MKQCRDTAQRRLIRSLLAGNRSHPTADEIYELAREQNPSISRGTIYRNLNQMADNGEIVRLSMPLGPDHYDSTTSAHYHFLCRHCKRVLDTGLAYKNELNVAAPGLPGCQTEFHRLTLVGLCDRCRKQ